MYYKILNYIKQKVRSQKITWKLWKHCFKYTHSALHWEGGRKVSVKTKYSADEWTTLLSISLSGEEKTNELKQLNLQ